MTPEAAFNMIRGTGDRAMTVTGTDGSRLREYDCENPENLISTFQKDMPMYEELGGVWITTGKQLTSCSNAKGHRYKIDFPRHIQTGAAPSAPAQNGVPFEAVIRIMTESQKENAALQRQLFEKQIQGLQEKKQKKEWWEDIDKIGAAIEKVAPVVQGFFNKGAGSTMLNRGIAGAPSGKTKLIYQEMSKQDATTLTKEFNEKLMQLQSKVVATDGIALLDFALLDPKALLLVYNILENPALLNLANIDPAKLAVLVEAINNKPGLIDTALNFLK